ncbi:proline dehydrogenase family protein [Pectobacteriaceae bacterium CE90]|nr:proline dehydrogenase family protein [Pectobacteriaceae bacterium CE90]
MNKDLAIIYKRYSSSELLFKYLSTKTLTHKLTRKFSLLFLKKYLSRPKGKLFSLINDIYFGGQTLDEVKQTAVNLAQAGISSILDYAVEGENDEAQFDSAVENTLRLIDMSQKMESIPFVVIKPSSLGRSAIYARQSRASVLNASSDEEWARIEARYHRIFEYAEAHNVRVMVDAEQTAIQPAVDRLVLNMMRVFNVKTATITLTLQFYLKDQLRLLDEYYQEACLYDFVLGVKVVRGAYLEEEKS